MFRNIVENTRDIIVVFERDKIIYANSSAAELLGLDSPEQLIGKDPTDYIIEKDRDWIREEIAEQYKKRDDKYYFQTKIKSIDGTVRDIAINASMIEWEAATAVLVIVRDITEIVKATRELEESEAEKRKILDLLPDEISFKDIDYRFIWVNQSLAKVLGKPLEEITGKRCYELAYNRDTPCEHCKIEQLKRNKKVIRERLTMVNGLIRDTYYVPVISDDEVVGVIEISRDITDLDRVQKENQEAMFKLRSLYQHTLSLDEANTEEEAYWITYKALKNSLEGVFFDLFLRKDDTMVESFAENTMSVSKEDKGVIARTFREGKTQLLNDTSSDPDYIAVERDAMRSELAVPIKIGEKVIGVINVEDETTGRFSDQDQWLLEIFASNISNTIERIKTVEELKRTNRISEAIIHGLRKILGNETFEYTARSIFDILRELIGAKAGYVALLSEDGSNNELLFLEAGGDPCSVDPELPMPIRGLREQAYQTGRAVFENDFFNSKWWDFLPEGHVFMKNVLFAPLNIEGKTVGVMGLANKETGFTQEDTQIAESFGELAALALTHSRYLEKIQQDERELEASERRYKNLFENLLGGYAYHKIILGEDGNPVDYMFLEVNQGFERLTGLKRENIIGKNVTEVIPNIEKDEVNWIKIYGEVALKGNQKTV